MTQKDFQQQMALITPDLPEHFLYRTEKTLENIASLDFVRTSMRTARSLSPRAILLAAMIAMLLFTVAMAATQGNLFEQLSFLTGASHPKNADTLTQRDLYQETVNNVEITVREASYDGRTLLVQYGYRMLDVSEPYGLNAKEVFGKHLPNGMEEDTIVQGLKPDAEAALRAHHVGWNLDQIWINGDGIENSGGVYQGSMVPGEIIYTEYWRLDNEGVTLKGPTEITLPIGEKLSGEECRALFDQETGMYRMPKAGMITFTYDAKDIQSQVKDLPAGVEKVLPDVTAKVVEAVFSPLMTYITLHLEVHPEAMAAFIATHGEGCKGEDGTIYWTYGGMDVFGDWVCSLELVDEHGHLIFPNHSGQNGYDNENAEFLYPYLENVPDKLYLSPMVDGVANMNQAVLVKK